MTSQAARILIVDDDKEMLVFLSEQLSGRGFLTETAASGGQAIENVSAGHFDLVLCDLKMPLMDGISCMESLAQLDPSLHVIIISGEATVDKAVRALKGGAYDFLQKPIQMEQLLFRIDKALLEKQLQAMTHLYEKSVAILSQLSAEEMLSPLLKTLARFFRADTLCWMEAHEDSLKIVCSLGLTLDATRCALLAAAERMLRESPQERRSFFMTNNFEDQIPGCTAILPLFHQDRLGAVMVLLRAGGDNFSLSELRRAVEYASQIDHMLESKKMQGSFDEKMRQLQKTYEALEQSKTLLAQKDKLAQLGELVADIAHEINSPLSTVMGYAELLLHHTDIQESVKDPLSIVYNEAIRCRDMVQDILQFSRRRRPVFRWTHLQQIVRETIDILALEFQSQGVRVLLKAPARMPGLAADPDMLKQVLINLLKNAAQAMDGQEKKDVQVEIRATKDTVRLTVRDSGPGIPREMMEKVFEPYFTTKGGQGSGIGLSLSAEIIRGHHGSISAQNDPDSGACFTIELPQTQPDFDVPLDRAA